MTLLACAAALTDAAPALREWRLQDGLMVGDAPVPRSLAVRAEDGIVAVNLSSIAAEPAGDAGQHGRRLVFSPSCGTLPALEGGGWFPQTPTSVCVPWYPEVGLVLYYSPFTQTAVHFCNRGYIKIGGPFRCTFKKACHTIKYAGFVDDTCPGPDDGSVLVTTTSNANCGFSCFCNDVALSAPTFNGAGCQRCVAPSSANAIITEQPLGTFNYACQAGYFNAPSSFDCSVSSGMDPAASSYTCASCVDNLPATPANANWRAISSNVFRYACNAGYYSSTGTFVDITCDRFAASNPFSASPPTCAVCTSNAGGLNYYCPGGDGISGSARVLCPGGRFATPGVVQTTSDCSGICSEGYYCPAGTSTSRTQFECGSVDKYCPAGSSSPTPVQTLPQYYSCIPNPSTGVCEATPGTETRRSASAICPSHRSCNGGRILPAITMDLMCPLGSMTVTAPEFITATFGPTLTASTQLVPISLEWVIVGAAPVDPGCLTGTAAFFTTVNVGGVTGWLMKTAQPLDYATCTRGIMVTLRARYPGAASSYPYPNTDLFADCSVQVNVRQVVRPPAITFCGPVTVPERSPPGTALAPAMTATSTNAGTSIFYRFFNTGGSPAFSIGTCDGAVRVMTGGSSLRFVTAPSFMFQVEVVNDGTALGLGTASSYCNITVLVTRAPRPPLLTTTSFSLPDLSPSGSRLGDVGAYDLDGYAIVRYAWSAVDVPDIFNVSSTGEIRLAVDRPDVLRLGKTGWSYTLNVTNEYGAWGAYPVSINLQPVPRAPVIVDQVRSIKESVAGGNFVSPPLNASHPQGTPFNFTGVTPSDTFGVTLDGRLFLQPAAVLDYNVQQSYSVSVRVTASTGLFSTAAVTINIEEVNKPPSFAARTWNFTVDEGSASNTLLLGPNVVATDPNRRDSLFISLVRCSPAPASTPFVMDLFTGALRVAGFSGSGSGSGGSGGGIQLDTSLTYWAGPQTFACELQVADSGTPTMTAAATAFVRITNVAPRIAAPSAPFRIPANATVGQLVGDVSPLVSTVYLRSTLAYALEYAEPTAEGDGTFEIDATTGVIAVRNITYGVSGAAGSGSGGGAGAPRWVFNTRSSFRVTVRATDTATGRSAVRNMTVVLDHTNVPPAWVLPLALLSAPSLYTGPLGTPLFRFATDADLQLNVGEELTFSLGGTNPGGLFAIDPQSGQLSLAAQITTSVPPSFTVTVCVTDKGVDGPPYTACAPLQIDVVLNSLPATLPVLSNLTVVEHSPVGTVVGYIRGAAAPGTAISYFLTPAGPNVNRPFPFAVRTVSSAAAGFPAGGDNVAELYVVNDGTFAPACPASPLEFTPTPPCGTTNVYRASVRAETYPNGPSRPVTATADVLVYVLWRAEAPFFNPATAPNAVPPTFLPNSWSFALRVPERSPPATVVSTAGGLLALSKDPWQRVPGVMRYRWIAAPGDAAAAAFTVDPVTAMVTVAPGAPELQFNLRTVYNLTLQVTDASGLTDTASVGVLVDDVNDVASFVPGVGVLPGAADAGVWQPSGLARAGPGNVLTLLENATAGTLVGFVRAHDEDRGAVWGARMYSLVQDGPDAAAFTVDASTGAIRVAPGAALDWNDQLEYRLSITASDADPVAPLTASVAVRVQLLQVSRVSIEGFWVSPEEEAFGRGVNVYAGAVQALGVTEGGTRIRINGTAFGRTARRLAAEGLQPSATRITASYGPTGREYAAVGCAVIVPNTVVECGLTEGVGRGHRWVVTVDGVWSSGASATATGYFPPAITSVTRIGADATTDAPQAMRTDAVGETVLVNGTNLGPLVTGLARAPVEVTLSYGPRTGSEYHSPRCVWVTPHTAVRCQAVPGVGGNFTWVAQVSLQVSAGFASSRVRYAAPAVIGVIAPRLNTRGGESFTLQGTNFGPAAAVGSPAAAQLTVRYSRWGRRFPVFSAVSCAVPASSPHTQMDCVSAPGLGSDLSVQVEVAGQPSPISAGALTYRSPTVTGISGGGADLADTRGGQTVLLAGDQFGPLSNALDFGPELLEVRYGHPWVLENATRAAAEVAAAAAAGREDGTWRLYRAAGCRVVAAHSQISCLTVEGTGAGLVWAASVGGQDSGAFTGRPTSYHPPIAALYSGPGSFNAETSGEQEVVIDGRHFGPAGTAVQAVNYYDQRGREFTAQNCSLVVPHATIACRTTVGAGSGLVWFVTIDGLRSVAPSTAYGVPIITGFSGPAAVDADTDGNQEVRITGRYFSTQEFLETVTYGPSGTEFTAVGCRVSVNHTEITCLTVPGTGLLLRWIVRVGGQGSEPSTALTSYAAPSILSVDPPTTPTPGGTLITLRATNAALAYASSSLILRFNARGLSPPPGTATLPDPVEAYLSALRAGLPAPAGTEAVPSWISSLPSPRMESSLIRGDGAHEIVFRAPPGFGTARELLLVVDGIPSTIARFSYDPPRIVNAAPDRQNMTQGGFLRLFLDGSSFCDGRDGCGTVLLNEEPVPVRSWTDSQVMLIVPDAPLSAPAQSVRVVVGGQTSNTMTFRRPVPNFDALVGQGSWVSMSTSGGERFYVAGVRDITGEEVAISIGGRACTDITRLVDNGLPADSSDASFTLSCRTPAGVGANLPVIITSLGGSSRVDSALLFSYAPPTLEAAFLYTEESSASGGRRELLTAASPSFSPFMPVPPETASLSSGAARLPTLGGLILLSGRDLGAAALLASAGEASLKLDGYITLDIVNHTHSRILARVPPVEGGTSRTIRISVAGQAGRTTLNIGFRAPTVLGVSPSRGPTRGGQLLTISGADFGSRGPENVTFVAADGTSSECRLAAPGTGSPFHNSTTCFAPAFQGAGITILVRVRGQLSTAPAAGAAAAGDQAVSMRASARRAQGSTAGSSGGFSLTFSYFPPAIAEVSPRAASTSGRALGPLLSDGIRRGLGPRVPLTVWGEDFGRREAGSVFFVPELLALTGSKVDPSTGLALAPIPVPAADVLSWNDSAVTLYAPEGSGDKLHVVVAAGNQASTPDAAGSTAFSYLPPTLVAWARTDRPPVACEPFARTYEFGNATFTKKLPAQCFDCRGGYTLSLVGLSFSRDRGAVRVTIGGRDAPVLFLSHDNMTVSVPRGLGDYNPIVVTVGRQVSQQSAATIFGYDPPVIDGISPSTPDADGGDVVIRGKNFGFDPTPASVNISGSGGWYMSPLVEQGGDSILQIKLTRDVVGPKRLEIVAANRSEPTVFFDFEQMMVTECKRGFTGLRGELCLECPRGAVCPGGEQLKDLLLSDKGFWRSNDPNPSPLCPVEHREPSLRPLCPVFSPCSPPESCLGANLCADGYRGERCAFCASQYYRVNGECIRCPDSPIAVMIAFVGLAIFGLAVSYLLTKYNITLALLTIGLDYAQVISIFARTRIRWPAAVLYIFKFLSAFNFNVEVAAPECLVETINFYNKWLAINLLPILAAGLLVTLFTVKLIYKALFLNRTKAELVAHAPQMFSVFIVAFRVLYLFLTRSALDVFSCSPTNPPDGRSYMAGMLDVVCGEPGSIQVKLLPYASLAIVVYVVGLPLAAFVFMWRNRFAIKYDQILRAKGVGDDRRTNPKHYTFRKTWSKLYHHFKPGKWYWEAIILARKFLIAFTSLMFRQTPDYQLAMALLVLFLAFLLHVKSMPYMTPQDKPLIVAQHLRKAEEGHDLHRIIEEDMRQVEKANKLDKRAGTSTKLSRAGAAISAAALAVSMSPADIVLHGLFASNTVEAVLLSCAVLVNLAGIMFNSARFNGEMARYYEREYDSLAFSVVTLIAVSLIYYALVLAADILVSCAPAAAARVCTCGKVEAAIARARARTKGRGVLRSGGKGAVAASDRKAQRISRTEYQLNVMFSTLNAEGQPLASGSITESDLASMTAPPGPLEWTAIKAAFAQSLRAVTGLQETVQSYKIALEKAGTAVSDAKEAALIEGARLREATGGALRGGKKSFTPTALGGGASAGAEDKRAAAEAPGITGASRTLNPMLAAGLAAGAGVGGTSSGGKPADASSPRLLPRSPLLSPSAAAAAATVGGSSRVLGAGRRRFASGALSGAPAGSAAQSSLSLRALKPTRQRGAGAADGEDGALPAVDEGDGGFAADADGAGGFTGHRGAGLAASALAPSGRGVRFGRPGMRGRGLSDDASKGSASSAASTPSARPMPLPPAPSGGGIAGTFPSSLRLPLPGPPAPAPIAITVADPAPPASQEPQEPIAVPADAHGSGGVAADAEPPPSAVEEAPAAATPPPSPAAPASDLPAGWRADVDDDGDTYYWHDDGRSQWERPAA